MTKKRQVQPKSNDAVFIFNGQHFHIIQVCPGDGTFITRISIGEQEITLDKAQLAELRQVLWMSGNMTAGSNLLGGLITGVRLLTPGEKHIHGWEDTPALALELHDGTLVYAATDQEMYLPGFLVIRTPLGQSFLLTPQVNGFQNTDPNTLVVVMLAHPNPDHGQFVPPAPQREVLVQTWLAASQSCREYIDEFDLGGGNWEGKIFNNGEQVAYVAYNGRIFAGKDWREPDSVCLYDPANELVTVDTARQQLQMVLSRLGISPSLPQTAAQAKKLSTQLARLDAGNPPLVAQANYYLTVLQQAGF